MSQEDARLQNLAQQSRHLAELHLQMGNFGQAFIFYLSSVKLYSGWKVELMTQISTALCIWGEQLETKKQYEDLLYCYEQALEVYDENPDILNNLGTHLYRMGHLTEARNFLKKAVALNPNFLPAISNLQNINNILVERWHFRMLNDGYRNDAFREAIQKKVQAGHTSVLDIGTGSGILSLCAVKAKAKHVYACETSETMIQLARKVLEANDAAESVKLINKKSNDLLIPEDISERVSLVVTEILDAGIFGEGILQTLIHAWEKLLLPKDHNPPGVVIPMGVTLWMCGIENDFLASRFRLLDKSANLAFGEDSDDAANHERISNIKLTTHNNEPYDCENLQRIPQDYRCLLEPSSVFEVDFNCYEKLKELLSSNNWQTVCVKCKTSGRLDALVFWFVLQLDEDIELTTNPLISKNPYCCWEQAVIPLPEPIHLEEGQQVNIDVCCQGGVLKAQMKNDSIYEMLPTYSISQEVIRYLNDKELMITLKKVSEIINCKPGSTILDMSPFPVLGLNIMKQNLQNKISIGSLMYIGSENDAVVVQRVAKMMGISEDKLARIATDSVDSFASYLQYFDVIILNFLESPSALNDKTCHHIPSLLPFLKSDGMFLPQKLSLNCQLAQSDWLDSVSRVISDDRTCGFKISEFINEYQVSHHLDMHLTPNNCRWLSDPCQLADIFVRNYVSSFRISSSIKINALGVVNAIPYWFTLDWLDREGGPVSSTRNALSFVNPVAALLNPHVECKVGSVVEVSAKYYNGLFYMTAHKICD